MEDIYKHHLDLVEGGDAPPVYNRHQKDFAVVRISSDWKKYDEYIMTEKIESVGCKPPYWKINTTFPSCKNVRPHQPQFSTHVVGDSRME